MNDVKPIPAAEAATDPPLDATLNGTQLEVHHELSRIDPQAARIYLGGIQVLAQRSNSTRFSLAAHSAREVIRTLTTRLGTPVAATDTMNAKVRELRESWDSAKSVCEVEVAIE